MKRVKLYGYLAEKYSPEYKLNVSSATEAVRALSVCLPEFGKDIEYQSFHIVLGDLEDGLYLDEETISLKTDQDIHILPAMEGAKGPGVLKTVIGAVLMIAAVWLGPMGAAMDEIGGPMIYGMAATAAMIIGTNLLLSGISMLLSPGVQQNSQQSNSGVFGNESGIAQQGAAVPLLYGEMYCDLMPISSAIENELHDSNTSDSIYQSMMNVALGIGTYWSNGGFTI